MRSHLPTRSVFLMCKFQCVDLITVLAANTSIVEACSSKASLFMTPLLQKTTTVMKGISHASTCRHHLESYCALHNCTNNLRRGLQRVSMYFNPKSTFNLMSIFISNPCNHYVFSPDVSTPAMARLVLGRWSTCMVA